VGLPTGEIPIPLRFPLTLYAVTVPLNPPEGVTVTVSVPLLPERRTKWRRSAQRKARAAVAVREMELSTVSPPDVPVSKIVYVPWQAEVLLAMNGERADLSEEVGDLRGGFGENEAGNAGRQMPRRKELHCRRMRPTPFTVKASLAVPPAL